MKQMLSSPRRRLATGLGGFLLLGAMVAAAGTQDRNPRPIPLGISGGNIHDMDGFYCCGGTLGSLVEDAAGNQYILSNNHVIGRSGRATVGDAIVQPGLLDVGCQTIPGDAVADLTTWVDLKYKGGTNLVDGAIAAVRPGMVDPSGAVHSIGTLSADTLPASIGLAVQKSGRTTGHTFGTVSSLDATVSVSYPTRCGGNRGKTATFVNTFFVTPGSFSAGGDSGSLIVESGGGSPRAVGLLFAGSSSYTIANPIDHVLDAFNVSMVGGGGPPAGTGSIAGFVRDAATGSGIGGAAVSVDSGQSTISNGDGSYTVSQVAIGTRAVSVSAAGYSPASGAVDVLENQTAVLDLALDAIPGGGGVKADAVGYDTTGGKNGDKNLLITVTAVDDGGAPVAGASVSIQLLRDGANAGTGTADTGSDGTVTFQLRNAADACYTTVVTDITASGLSYAGVYPANGFQKGVDATPDVDTLAAGDDCGGAPFGASAGKGLPDLNREFEPVIRIKRRHEAALMQTQGVIGVAVGFEPGAGNVIQVFTDHSSAAFQPASLPSDVEGIPVRVIPTEPFSASW
jgi:hypothetical protein